MRVASSSFIFLLMLVIVTKTYTYRIIECPLKMSSKSHSVSIFVITIYFVLNYVFSGFVHQVWNHKGWNARIPDSNGSNTSACKSHLWDRSRRAKILWMVSFWRDQRRWERQAALSRCKCCIQARSPQCHWLSLEIRILKRTGLWFHLKTIVLQTIKRHVCCKYMQNPMFGVAIFCEHVFFLLLFSPKIFVSVSYLLY